MWQVHGTVCNYTLIYAHLNGIYQGWGVIAAMNGIVYQPPWTFRPSCYARRLPIDTCLVSKKFYKSLTNYDFGVAMGGLLLKLQNFKKVKLIFGHPVCSMLMLFTENRTYSSLMISWKKAYIVEVSSPYDAFVDQSMLVITPNLCTVLCVNSSISTWLTHAKSSSLGLQGVSTKTWCPG